MTKLKEEYGDHNLDEYAVENQLTGKADANASTNPGTDSKPKPVKEGPGKTVTTKYV